MELINKKDDKIIFSVDMSDSLANAIRRYSSEIPILAIDEVEFLKNDSTSYDETIAHRIGLIPLKMDHVSDKNKIQLKLSVNKEGTVYSGSLKGNVELVHDKIPITILDDEHELELVATAKLGTGSEHAKFSPGIIFYRDMKEIKSGSKGKEINHILSNCRNNCGKNKNIENNKSYVLDLCDSCESDLEEIGIEVVDTDKLVMIVETFGQLPSKEVFLSSVNKLKKDLDEVSKKI